MTLGIHGRPFVAWDGVTGPYQRGYCTHGSILFPIWHRPYLALLEVCEISLSNYNTMLTLYSKCSGTSSRYCWNLPRICTCEIPRRCCELPDPVLGLGQQSNDASRSQQTYPPNQHTEGRQTLANPLYNYTFNPKPSATDFPPNKRVSTSSPFRAMASALLGKTVRLLYDVWQICSTPFVRLAKSFYSCLLLRVLSDIPMLQGKASRISSTSNYWQTPNREFSGFSALEFEG